MVNKNKDWLDLFKNDPKKRDEILENLEKTGAPLEYRVSSILVELGYYPTRTVYEDINKDGEEIFRDMDIIASKSLQPYEKDRIEIHFELNLIVECKSPIN